MIYSVTHHSATPCAASNNFVTARCTCKKRRNAT